ncbi:MAG: diguanylate cyclase, partial [Inhella sp.]
NRPPMLALLAASLLVLALLELMLQQSKRSIEVEAAQRASTLALAAGARVDGLFARARLWLDELERVIDPEELRADKAPEEQRLAELAQWLDDLRRRNPHLANIGYLDAKGRSYRQRGAQGNRLSLADTDYWKQLKALGPAGAGRLIVTPVHTLRTTGKPGLVLARGLYGRDRQLAGAIVVGIHAESLEQMLENLNAGPGNAVLLLDRDELLVARHPPISGAGTRRMAAPRLPGPDASSYFVVSRVDGKRRLGSSVELRDAPLRIAVGLSEDNYLAEWRRHRSNLRLAMAALVIAALLAAALLLRTTRVSQALQRSEDLLGVTLGLLPTAALHAAAPSLHVLHSNAAAQSLLDLPAQPGVRLDQLFDDPERMTRLLATLARDGELGPIDVLLRRGTQRFWATVQLRRLQDGNDLLMTLIDVDARHQREAELLEQSTTDQLTGVANRRAFEAAAAKWLTHCRRHGEVLSLLLIDLDHFKAVNDSLGHAAGDQVLRAVADGLQLQLRSPDVLARVGGEEFVALLPNTELPAAQQVAQRVLAHPRNSEVELQDGQRLRVSASIGLSACLPDETDIDWALARADAAMYRAKSQGRDRYAVQQ